jgi:MFS family permease
MTHAPTPLIPLHYFSNRNFVFPMIVRVAANFAYFGGFILFPILMEVGYHASTGKVGTISVARPIVFALSSPIAGYAAVKFGERRTTIFGTTALLVSMVVFAFASVGTSVWWLVLALGLSGIGMGVAMPSTSATMANEVDEHEYGVMSAAQLIATQVGEVAGIQIVIALQGARLRHFGAHPTMAQALSSFHASYIVGAAVAVAGVAAALFMRSMDRTEAREELPPVLEA